MATAWGSSAGARARGGTDLCLDLVVEDALSEGETRMPDGELTWVPGPGDYTLALAGKKLVCKNGKGKRLKSLPKAVKTSEPAEALLTLAEWLTQHERECAETVEGWMLRSLPIPKEAIVAVWDDPAWRTPLENAVVTRPGDLEGGGFLKGADAARGVGVVDLDGETQWIDAPTVLLPHPILLPERDDFRELATELSLTQGVHQLFRETHAAPQDLDPEATGLGTFSNGHFEQLNFVLGRCRTLGYRVRGGFATCPVFEGGVAAEARYWIGAEYPEGETWTGELIFVDEAERALPLGKVGPVTLSEGLRMATAIYAGRKVEEEAES